MPRRLSDDAKELLELINTPIGLALLALKHHGDPAAAIKHLDALNEALDKFTGYGKISGA